MRIGEDPEDIVGKKFNKLLVLKHLGVIPTGIYINKRTGKRYIASTRYYLRRCECGIVKKIALANLKTQKGCKYCAHDKPDPKFKNPLYKRWKRILKEGIYVCDRWLSSFDNFVKDAGKPSTAKYIFSCIDKNKGYIPENCKWMSRSENAYLKNLNKELTVANLARRVNMPHQQIWQIADREFRNKDIEFLNLIERIDITKRGKRIIFKPEAIEYFINKKYIHPKAERRVESVIKQFYLKGIEAEIAARQLGKTIESVKKYYKKFASENHSKKVRFSKKKLIINPFIVNP